MKLLLIGAITNSEAKYKDGIRKRFGGGVMYGARAALKLGIDTTVITIGAEDIEGGVDELKSLGAKVERIKRESSNNASNDYTGDTRKIFVRSYIKKPIDRSELPVNIDQYDCVVLLPILHEMTIDILESFSKSQKILLDPQGFCRLIGLKNKDNLYPVTNGHLVDVDKFAIKTDVLKLSKEDLDGMGFPEGITSEEQKFEYLTSLFKLVVLTKAHGETVVGGKNIKRSEIPANKAEVVDSAGAGDTFAVAFMYKYFLTKDPVLSVKFGNACAALKISGEDFNVEKVEAKIRS